MKKIQKQNKQHNYCQMRREERAIVREAVDAARVAAALYFEAQWLRGSGDSYGERVENWVKAEALCTHAETISAYQENQNGWLGRIRRMEFRFELERKLRIWS